MLSGYHNSIKTKAMSLIFALIDIVLSQDIHFTNHSSSNACNMVLKSLPCWDVSILYNSLLGMLHKVFKELETKVKRCDTT